MYELNRARLVGIGPRGARYNDVTIDLAGAGEPTGRRNNSWAEDVRRPAPCSLLLLENGGGKSVLLRLLFSVVLPGRRNTVGGASLDSYVLDRDTGHVAIEWMHVETGELLITGKVFESKGRGNEPTVDAWYSFRPSTTVSLETLPVVSEGRRVRLVGFKEAIDEAERNDATTALVWAGSDQTRWRDHLTDCGIDPALFALQRRMNGDEGEAAKAFKFTSGEGFVDWLLDMTLEAEDLTAVVKNFDEWATNLAKRSQWLLEKDFLEGVIAGLEPLAEAHEAHQEAEQGVAAAERAAVVLARALRRRHHDDQLAVLALGERLDRAKAVVSSRNTERDNATQVVREIVLQTARLDLAATAEHLAAVKEQLKVADLEMHGWEMMPAVESLESLIVAAKALAEQVAAADSTAAPALRRRDEAAGRLIAKYHAEADTALKDAAGHDAAAIGATEAASVADAERTEATTAKARAEERHAIASARVAEAHERLVTAVADGTIPAGTAIADVPDLAENAREAHIGLVRRLEASRDSASSAAQLVKDAANTLNTAEKELRARGRQAEDTAAALATVEVEARRIGGLPAVAEVFGGGGDDGVATATEVDEGADRILDALQRNVTARTEHLDTLRMTHAEDERVAEALGSGGFLPPRPDVTATVDALRAADIGAHAGWTYLVETAPASDRLRLVRARPDLVDGVVLVDGTQMSAAQRALEAARILPAAAVAVGAGVALLQAYDPTEQASAERSAHAHEPEVVQGFVVEPSPAMYDASAAETRREELTRQIDTRAFEMAALLGELDEVAAALASLRRWREANPSGRLTRLAEAASAAQAGLEAAQVVRDNADDSLTSRRSEQDQADIVLADAITTERRGSDLVGAVRNLADLVVTAVEAQRSLAGLVLEARQYQEAADQALERRRKAEAEFGRQTSLAAQVRSQVEQYRAAAAEVTSTSGSVADTVPSTPLAELKSAAAAAQQAYLALEVDKDLRERAASAAAKVKAQRDELDVRPREHVAEARRLRSTSAASDRAAWNVAQSNVRATVVRLSEEVDDLQRREGRLQGDVDRARPASGPSWTNLTSEWVPMSVETGRELEVRAQRLVVDAQARLDEANLGQTRVERLQAEAEDTVRGIKEALLPLTALVHVPDDDEAPGSSDSEPVQGVVAYAGDVDSALAASARAVIAKKETAEHADATRAALASALKDVTSFANLDRYARLEAPLRRSVLQVSPESLAVNAGRWADSMRSRWASLGTDLENTNRHRAVIVDRLIGLIDKSLKTIGNAERLSKMPEDLGDWGGRRFLEISFKKPDKAVIAVRAGEAIDRAADAHASGGGGKNRNPRRDGLGLLQETLHAAVPKGFTVTALKPDTVLRDERVSIENMNDVFSGGQELTGAMIMYCVLAALNAHESGRSRSRHSGILFLDNPVGRANASYLIDMQQAVAKALGVQLIFTTGLTEDRVLASFPLWVRLRNDADYRAGLKYLKVAATSRDALPPPYTPAELAQASGGTAAPGSVTAATVHRQPQVSVEAHGQPDSGSASPT